MIDDLREDFTDHDVFLHLVLGLLSATGRVTRLLPTPAEEAAPSGAAGPPRDERFLHLLLGIVSVRTRLLQALEPEAAAAAAAPRSEREPEPLSDLLR